MTNVETLARDWLSAKRAEAEAAARRHAIEAQLCEALDVLPEGARTHKLNGFNVTIHQPIIRKLCPHKWMELKTYCPPALRPIKTKIEPDAGGCRYLANNEPEIWRLISPAFETKPGKAGFKVEEFIDGD